MDTPYQAVCPQIEQDRGDESSVFSNPNGVPITSSFHIPGHLQHLDQCCQHKVARKKQSNGHACSQPSLSLIAPWLLQGLIPCCAIADSSFPQQYHCNKLKWQNIEILCILCWGNQLSMCNVEIIFSTFLSFLADVSETQRFLGYGGDARWKVMPFTETSTYEEVREMRTPSLLLRVNPL